jgi:GntR family transcriptional regulator, transcriptional repressor for pyruvate dehydrogenase complex
VVREALSMLQAAERVVTRHGIGTFVAEAPRRAEGFRIAAEQLETLREVIAVLELRIALEAEAAGLAAQRRQPGNLEVMAQALAAMEAGFALHQISVEQDFLFHLEIARATQNPHFAKLMQALGESSIPRARLGTGGPVDAATQDYLRQVLVEHRAIYSAIADGDAESARATMRMHLVNSRDRRKRAQALADAAAAPGRPPGV